MCVRFPKNESNRMQHSHMCTLLQLWAQSHVLNGLLIDAWQQQNGPFSLIRCIIIHCQGIICNLMKKKQNWRNRAPCRIKLKLNLVTFISGEVELVCDLRCCLDPNKMFKSEQTEKVPFKSLCKFKYAENE